ncbi:Cyclin, C-terminal domain [Rhizoctonia solani]|uniref:Cyclin, C-terminal domain n=2 Tax=Rhizoctonia solani TaxID=456999 RepID=A0A8H8NVE6_9AGAM|nr:Cyclin, C-terminal domain [Rhizoctonia solani]QRW19058.1 Cyclin, C-terminal domain [Rhizoctonia solani]
MAITDAPTNTESSAPPPPAAPKQPLYESSTQFKHWRFSPEQLAKSRRELNQAAVESLKKLLEEEEPGSTSSIHFLTPEEERALVVYYARVIGSMCVRIGLSEEVEATATSYLKRFYLKNTVMDWHPMNVTITILFLATKTSNMPISLDYYVSKLPSGKTEAADVLALEFLVAQSLNFEFSVWHAHRALWGIVLDIQSIPEIDQESTKHTHSAALQHIRNSRLTDAELIYTPSQIAMACLYLADPQLAETYLSQKGSGNMLSVVQEAAAMIERDGKGTDVGLVREIDFRLKTCKNPERVKGSKAYEARQAKADAAADKKRALKATASLEARMSQDEMFGPSISLPSGDPQSSPLLPLRVVRSRLDLGVAASKGRMTELGLTGDTIGGIAEVDSPTSAQFVDVQGNLKDEENGGEGGDMAGPLLDKVPEVRITETSSPSPPPPRTSTQTDPLPHSHASSSRASLLPPAAATGSTRSRRATMDGRANRLSGFFSQLLTTRRPEREPPMPRERSVSPPPSPMRPTRPVTPPPPLAPPTLSELGLQLSIITSNLTTAQYAMAPTSGTFLAPHYLLLCHGQGLDVLPLNAPPAPQPYALVRRVSFKSVIVMEERGVLVAIAGRRDGVRVYALEEVRRAVEWRLDLELKREAEAARRSRSKGTPGVTIPASNSAPSALQPSKPTAPPPSYSASVDQTLRPLITRVSTTNLAAMAAAASPRHRGGSLSSIVGLAQNGTQKSEWAELQASDEEVLVAAGPEASAALDERTSAAAQQHPQQAAPVASVASPPLQIGGTSARRATVGAESATTLSSMRSALAHSRSNSQLLPRGPTTAETDAEPEVGIDSVSMAEMLRESRMPPPQVPANTTQRRASVVMLQSQTHPVFQPGELDPVGEDTDPPPTPGDDVRPRRWSFVAPSSSSLPEPIASRPPAHTSIPANTTVSQQQQQPIDEPILPHRSRLYPFRLRPPSQLYPLHHLDKDPTARPGPSPHPAAFGSKKHRSKSRDRAASAHAGTSSGAGPSGNGHTEGAPPEGPAAAPKLEYIKLPGTKGAIMIKAVETPKKSFLAILCGESGEKVELFAGTYRTALGLSRTFILPDSPKSLELQLQGDDLVEVFLVFAQNVFGLEPATVRVREVRIGRNERRAIRRRARAANGGSRTIEPSEAGQAGGGAASRAAETVITTTVSVGEDHQPASPASRRSTSLVRRRREVQGRIVTAPDVPVPIPPVPPVPQPTDPTMAEELAALSSIQSGPYTTFQQLSLRPNFLSRPSRTTISSRLPILISASTGKHEPVVVVEGLEDDPAHGIQIDIEPESEHEDERGDEQAIIESSPIPTPSHTPPPPPVQPAQVPAPAVVKWYYLDPKGVVQGPWKPSIMQNWLREGYLPPELPVRRADETEPRPVVVPPSPVVPPTPTVIPPTPVDEPVVVKPEPVRASGSELTEVPEKVESGEESGTHIPAVERTSTPGASTSSVAEPSGSNTPVEANGTNTPSKASTSQIPAEVNTSKPPTESSPSQTPAQTQPSSSTSQTTSKPNPPDPFKPTKALLKPLSLLAQPRHFGPPALFYCSRGGHSTTIVDARGRPVLKGRIHWSSNDAMGDTQRIEAFDVGDRAVFVALRQGGIEALDVGEALLEPGDESRTAVPAYRVAVSGGTSRRAPWVWKLGTSVSALGNSAVDTPQPSAATGNGNASGHGNGNGKRRAGGGKRHAESNDDSNPFSDSPFAFLSDEGVIFLARQGDSVYMCERNAGKFRLLKLSKAPSV